MRCCGPCGARSPNAAPRRRATPLKRGARSPRFDGGPRGGRSMPLDEHSARRRLQPAARAARIARVPPWFSEYDRPEVRFVRGRHAGRADQDHAGCAYLHAPPKVDWVDRVPPANPRLRRLLRDEKALAGRQSGPAGRRSSAGDDGRTLSPATRIHRSPAAERPLGGGGGAGPASCGPRATTARGKPARGRRSAPV